MNRIIAVLPSEGTRACWLACTWPCVVQLCAMWCGRVVPRPSRVPPAGWLSTYLLPCRNISAPHFHLSVDFKAALGVKKGISLRRLPQDSEESLSEGTTGQGTKQPLASRCYLFKAKQTGFSYPARALLLCSGEPFSLRLLTF